MSARHHSLAQHNPFISCPNPPKYTHTHPDAHTCATICTLASRSTPRHLSSPSHPCPSTSSKPLSFLPTSPPDVCTERMSSSGLAFISSPGNLFIACQDPVPPSHFYRGGGALVLTLTVPTIRCPPMNSNPNRNMPPAPCPLPVARVCLFLGGTGKNRQRCSVNWLSISLKGILHPQKATL